MARKGMMVGKGGRDPAVHSQSAKGIKQPQKVNTILPLNLISMDKNLKDLTKQIMQNEIYATDEEDFDSGNGYTKKKYIKDLETIKEGVVPLNKMQKQIATNLIQKEIDLIDEEDFENNTEYQTHLDNLVTLRDKFN
jgi:hypothetical protein